MWDSGHTQLVGSFTGEKATLFRKKYADAFDAMEAELLKKPETSKLHELPTDKLVEIIYASFKKQYEVESGRLIATEKNIALEEKVEEDAPNTVRLVGIPVSEEKACTCESIMTQKG